MQRMRTPTGRAVTMASRGMVAAPHYLAAEAGVWALQQGGNAVDAAVAANAVLAVVYPHMAGLGGDALLMVWEPGRQEPICLNGSGHSACQATIEFYRDRGHETVPTRGPLAALTVPGAVAAWGDAHERWGGLPWQQVLEPAIHYAESGFPVTTNLATWLARVQDVLTRFDTSRRIFLRDGQPYAQGQVLVQGDLAQTLRVIADDGPSAFYLGDLADEMLAYLREHGSPLAHQDLQDHHSDWVDPVGVTYRGHIVYEFPPNSQGVVASLILNLLGGYDLAAMGDETARYYHTLVEASRVAQADLEDRIGDPNHVSLPLEPLLSPVYAEARRALILPDRTRPQADYAQTLAMAGEPSPRAPTPAGATAYVAAVDADGRVVSLIQSLHEGFGSGLVAGRTGVVLQNSGASFSLCDDEARGLEPHKRPYQPLMPGLVFDGERPWLIFGASGGESEPQTHAALLTRAIDFGYNVQQAIEAPRWFLAGGPDGQQVLSIEGRVADSVLRQLREMGHDVKVAGDWSELVGQAQGIMIDTGRGVFHGGADPRGDGQASGW